jgi:hypothetical protein
VAALTSTADRASSELADALSAVVAELAALRALIDAVEHRLSPSTQRREDRAALERTLPAIAGALGSDLFLAIEAVTSDNPALVLVLGAMDARRLGKLLRRGADLPIDGYIVHAQGMEAGAVLWEVLRLS